MKDQVPLFAKAARALVLSGALFISACEVPDGLMTGTVASQRWSPQPLFDIPEGTSLERMREENTSRSVNERFADRPQVIDEEAGRGSSQMFFRNASSVIVAGPSDAAQLRAASLAVFTHAPVLSYHPETHDEVVAELTRLDAAFVLAVGNVGFAETVGETTVIHDPGTIEGLGQMTAHSFIEYVVTRPEDMVPAVASLDGRTPVLLSAGWEQLSTDEHPVPSFPILSRRDAQDSPIVVATLDTPVVDVANVRSYGAGVRVLEEPDPRNSRATLAAMTGLAHEPLIALGQDFHSNRELAVAITEAENAALQ